MSSGSSGQKRALLGGVEQVVEETPGISLAAIGLGLAVANRMARLQVSSSSFPSLDVMAICTGALALAMLAMALLYRLHPRARLHRHPAVGFSVALACSAACLLARGALPYAAPDALVLACEVVTQVGAGVLILIWGETLYPYGLGRTATVFALASCVAACTTAALGSIKQELESGVLACVPVFSMMFLYFFLEYNASRSGFTVERSLAVPEMAPSKANGVLPLPYTGGFVVVWIAFFFLVRFGLGHATTSWIVLSGGQGASVVSQFSSAGGMLLAGLVLLIIARLDGADAVRAYPYLLVTTLFVALLVVFALGRGYLWASILLVVAEQLLLILPAYAAPFLAAPLDGNPRFSAEATVFFACAAGSSVGAAFQGHAPEGVITPVLVLALAALAAVSMMSGWLLGGYRRQQYVTGRAGAAYFESCRETLRPTCSVEADGDASGSRNAHPLSTERPASATGFAVSSEPAAACEEGVLGVSAGVIADRYQLTRRERDIFYLLVARYSNAEVAETLVISMATVRTHIRNIYAKLDVHSAKELRDLCVSEGLGLREGLDGGDSSER